MEQVYKKKLKSIGDLNNKNYMRFFVYRNDMTTEEGFPIHDCSVRAKSALSAIVMKEFDTRLISFREEFTACSEKSRLAYNFFMEPAFVFSELAVMAPQKKGLLGVEALNLFLRDITDSWYGRFIAGLEVMPAEEFTDCIKSAEARTRNKRSLVFKNVPLAGENYFWDIRFGDRMMCVKNDYSNMVFNGECGTVVGINSGNGTFRIKYPGRETICSYRACSETQGEALPSHEYLIPAYAMTIHKSQGSEYESVCLVISPEHTATLSRNLLYTGVSRARSALTVITDVRSWEGALMREENLKETYSGALAELIQHYSMETAGKSPHIPRQT